MTGVIADQIYAHLDHRKLLPEEQKRCRKVSTGANDLLYIDRAVIIEVKSRNKNLAIVWIDINARDKWYEHEPESVLENEDYKMLWDFSIQTDHVIEGFS